MFEGFPSNATSKMSTSTLVVFIAKVLRERSTSSTPLLVGERLLRYGTNVLTPDEPPGLNSDVEVMTGLDEFFRKGIETLYRNRI